MTDRSIWKKKNSRQKEDGWTENRRRNRKATQEVHQQYHLSLAVPLLLPLLLLLLLLITQMFPCPSPPSQSSALVHKTLACCWLPWNCIQKAWKKKGGERREREEGAFITMTKAAPGVNVVDFAVHTTSSGPSITSPLASFVLAAVMDVMWTQSGTFFHEAQWLNSKEEDILNRSSSTHTYSVQDTLSLMLLFYPFTS